MRDYIINFTYRDCKLIVLFFVHVHTRVSLVVLIIDSKVSMNLLEEANLKPPKHSTSHVWKYFGFQHEDGVVKDPTHVSYFHSRLSQKLPVDADCFHDRLSQNLPVDVDCCPLTWWKVNHSQFPKLASLAQKTLCI